jgi:hypothetical protein
MGSGVSKKNYLRRRDQPPLEKLLCGSYNYRAVGRPGYPRYACWYIACNSIDDTFFGAKEKRQPIKKEYLICGTPSVKIQ